MREPTMQEFDRVEDQLSRILSFFPRVESRITNLFGANTMLLTVAALNLDAGDLKRWYVAIPGTIALIAICVSYVFL